MPGLPSRLTPRSAVRGFMVAASMSLSFLVAVSPSAQAQPQFDSSFDCGRDNSPLMLSICADEQVRRADLEQLQAYYILRHASPIMQQEYRNRLVAAIRQIRSECDIQPSNIAISCAVRNLSMLRENWISNIRDIQNSAALDESRLSPAEFFRLQSALREAGYLPGNSVIDGIYGTGTRQAIMRLQTERGLPASGFMTSSTAQVLTGTHNNRPRAQQPQFSNPPDTPRSQNTPANQSPRPSPTWQPPQASRGWSINIFSILGWGGWALMLGAASVVTKYAIDHHINKRRNQFGLVEYSGIADHMASDAGLILWKCLHAALSLGWFVCFFMWGSQFF
jgi:hypothetical protein